MNKSPVSRIYRSIFPSQYDELHHWLKGCESLLDLACGSSSPIGLFKLNCYSVGVDIHEPSIVTSRAKGIHSHYLLMDILEADKHFAPASFDCIVALDLIEHFTPEEGLKLIGIMERLARKRVIIITPNGFLPQEPYDDNPFQRHRSGWEVEQMRGLGYRVVGLHGLKWIRGEKSSIRFKPFWFWQFMSDITQLVVKHTPRHSFKILCVKDIGAAK